MGRKTRVNPEEKAKSEDLPDIAIDGPSDEALLQALYQMKARQVERLEVENARLTLIIQELGRRIAQGGESKQ